MSSVLQIPSDKIPIAGLWLYNLFLCEDSKSVPTKKEKTGGNLPLVFLLLGYPDSNQERQDQNLQCYRYTIAQGSL